MVLIGVNAVHQRKIRQQVGICDEYVVE